MKQFLLFSSITLLLTMTAAVRTFAQYDNGERWGSVKYIDSHWDKNTRQVVTEEKNDWMVIRKWSTDKTQFGARGKVTWYAIEGKRTDEAVKNGESNISTMEIMGEVHIVLLDGAVLSPHMGIYLEAPDVLHIHVQSKGDNQGKIIINKPGNYPAIGAHEYDFGELHIHGGYIDVTGGGRSSGIGTAAIEDATPLDIIDFVLRRMGRVYVYDGTLKVHGGERGAGIGGGSSLHSTHPHTNYGVYTQYGGDVTVWGGETAAGLGGGGCYAVWYPNILSSGGRGMTVNMYGGKLTAYGGRRAAGIGSGSSVRSNNLIDGGTVNVYGGTVYAKGGDYGAGIGGGCNGSGAHTYIYGGTVTAIGGKDAAGVGGGEDSSGAKVIVDGGTLRAEGNGTAAGIGGGEGKSQSLFEYKSGNVIAIAGGKCKAREAKGGSAIGSGKGEKYKRKILFCNHIKLAADCKVTAGDAENNVERTFTTIEREAACRWRNFAKLETCEHEEFGYEFLPDDNLQHKKRCRYCAYEEMEDHNYSDGEHCVCGKTANKDTELWAVTVKTTTNGTTYDKDSVMYVVRTRACALPEPAEVEGLVFMGYQETTTAPESIEMKNGEISTVVDAGQSVTPTKNTTYYARYAYDYSEDWTWSDDYESATVTISNTLTGESKAITATVTEDETERVEPQGNKLGMMTLNATAVYNRSANVSYLFRSRVRVEYFNPAVVDLDAAADNNGKILEEYIDHISSVNIYNMTLKKDGKLHPLCLPFSMTASEMAGSPLAGATLYRLDSSERVGSQLQLSFKKVTDGGLAAGEPYFVKWTSGTDIEEPEFNGVIVKESVPWMSAGDYFYLCGNFDTETIPDEDLVYGTYLKLNDGEKLEEVSYDVVDAFSNYLFIPNLKADDGSTAVCSVRLDFEDGITVEKFITYGFEGDGTAENPYIICNARQLSDMATYFNSGDEGMQGKYFKQGGNCTFDKTQENNFTPITKFNGSFDGAGYIISGMNINKSGTEKQDEVAPFMELAENSELKNIIIANSTFTGRTAAALVNELRERALIDNCHVLKDVSVRSNYYIAAGLAAYSYSGSPTLRNSTSQATVTSNQSYAAGLVGALASGTMTGCSYLGSSLTHGSGAYRANPIVAIKNDGTVSDCYYTDATLSDKGGKLMPQYDKDVDNTDFLTRLHERDEFLLSAGLTGEDIGYDMTMNNRATLSAVQSADGTWKSKAYVVCLPFEVDLMKQSGLDLETYNQQVTAFRPHRIDLDKKELIFTNCLPVLHEGEAYIVVVKKGSVALSADNVTVVATPAEPDKIMSIADENRQIGEWVGTFSRIDNAQMMEDNIYIAQSKGTFRCPPKGYTTAYVNPFVGYFSALEPLDKDRYTIKYVYTGQADDDDETGEVEDFPADTFDSDMDFDETGVISVHSSEFLPCKRSTCGASDYTVHGSEADGCYTLDGRKVKSQTSNLKPQISKGIYINNGKKVVVY